MKTLLGVLAAFALGTAGALAAPVSSEVTIPVRGGTLHGTLLMPATKARVPVALIIAGSGPTDRNGNQFGAGSDAYEKLAQGLAGNGIATLRYDKRGIAASVFPALGESDLRFTDFVDDAAAALQMLLSDKRFKRVSVIGHSEGSLVGMLAAQRARGIDAYVSVAGAGEPAETLLLEQLSRPQNASLLPESTRIVHELEAGRTATVPAEDRSLQALFHAGVQPYLISWFRYDPATEIAKVKARTLIVQGTHDVQISVAQARRLHAALPGARYAEIPEMNHVFRDAPDDFAANVATYTQPQLPLDATFVATVARFLNATH